MNTRISSKLAAFAVALMINGVIVGATAYLFNSQLRQNSVTVSLQPARSQGVS